MIKLKILKSNNCQKFWFQTIKGLFYQSIGKKFLVEIKKLIFTKNFQKY
jgi:hypothetical protein